MGDKVFTLKTYYEHSIPLDDGDDASASIPLRIRRFSVVQLQEFQRGFSRVMSPEAQRFIYRKADGDEQQMRDIPANVGANGVVLSQAKSVHLIPDEEITRRRMSELSPAEREAFDAASQEDDDFMASFCSEAISKHVSLPPDVTLKLIQDDGSEVVVRDGSGLVAAFGGNLSMLLRLTRLIHRENTLTPEAKKHLRSLSVSTASSPQLEGDGRTPAATAIGAVPAVTASNDGASAVQAPNPSGLIPVVT